MGGRLTSSSLVLAAAHGRAFTASVPASEAPMVRTNPALVVPCCCSSDRVAWGAPTLPRHRERMCMMLLGWPKQLVVGQKAKACARDATHRRKEA